MNIAGGRVSHMSKRDTRTGLYYGGKGRERRDILRWEAGSSPGQCVVWGRASVRERKKVRSKAQMCPTGIKAEATLRNRLWADVFHDSSEESLLVSS